MATQKVDYQKINSLKAKVYDKMVLIEQNTLEANRLIEPYNKAIQELQREVVELNKEISEEQNKVVPK